MNQDKLRKLVKKKGSFKLKSGKTSEYYYDFRNALGNVESRKFVLDKLIKGISDSLDNHPHNLKPLDVIISVHGGAVPWATLLANHWNIPFGYVRPTKNYGTCNSLECLVPHFDFKGKAVLLFDDIVTTEGSLQYGRDILKFMGVYVEANYVKDFVIMNRNENSKVNSVWTDKRF